MKLKSCFQYIFLDEISKESKIVYLSWTVVLIYSRYLKIALIKTDQYVVKHLFEIIIWYQLHFEMFLWRFLSIFTWKKKKHKKSHHDELYMVYHLVQNYTQVHVLWDLIWISGFSFYLQVSLFNWNRHIGITMFCLLNWMLQTKQYEYTNCPTNTDVLNWIFQLYFLVFYLFFFTFFSLFSIWYFICYKDP